MHVVIFSGGNVEPGRAIDLSLQKADFIIAADSGADAALSFGVTPSYVVGDFDSLPFTTKTILQKKQVAFISFPPEKDETDTELAVLFALKQGATDIAILGGVAGNRLDHVLANVFLTFHTPIPVRFINGNQISWIMKGQASVEIAGTSGDLLSLLPLSETVDGIDTNNLEYPLQQGTLPLGKSRGISNVLTAPTATVSFVKGVLLFVHTLTV